ncbi:pentapeptide repeat protein [Anabaenopsis circularis NIES-21]|uniref:Pentapeptide repeat protein n=1 Tax=Anabaenopsis circularis NIES-21 TaxID=1085406 RepID=A0A1Z4GCL0_9CYAN|nr:pentapeptide repeat protein [Anabaenopsis circularis NIES-21]
MPHMDAQEFLGPYAVMQYMDAYQFLEDYAEGVRYFCEKTLSEVNFSGRDLRSVMLRLVNLSEACLIGADLRGAMLSEIDLSSADLSGADLRGVIMSNVDLSLAKLNGADLSGASIVKVKLNAAHLRGAKLCGAHIDSVDFSDADVEETDFRGAEFSNAFERFANKRKNGDNVVCSSDEVVCSSETMPNNAVNNQGIPYPNSPLYKWNRLWFRSKSEIKIAQAFDRANVFFMANCLARLSDPHKPNRRFNLEPDFVVCHQGKWGILEVDGHYHRPENRAKEQERERQFQFQGIRAVYRFDASRCYQEPDTVVSEFLKLIEIMH